LPKDESFANKIFHKLIPPHIAIEGMTGKLGILLNIDQEPTTSILGHRPGSLKSSTPMNEMSGRSKEIAQRWRFWRLRFHIFIVLMIPIVIGGNGSSGGGGIDSRTRINGTSKGRCHGTLHEINILRFHECSHERHATHDWVWFVVHETHGACFVWSPNGWRSC
jgi:hypothetical protein